MSKDRFYYIQRAEEELEIAQTSNEPAAVKAHYTLAGYYLDRAYGTPDDVEDSPRMAQAGPAIIAQSTSAPQRMNKATGSKISAPGPF